MENNLTSAGKLEKALSFGSLVRSELKKQKKTQKSLSAEVGLSTTLMTSIVTGRYFPIKKHIDDICKALKVKLIFQFEPYHLPEMLYTFDEFKTVLNYFLNNQSNWRIIVTQIEAYPKIQIQKTCHGLEKEFAEMKKYISENKAVIIEVNYV